MVTIGNMKKMQDVTVTLGGLYGYREKNNGKERKRCKKNQLNYG